jgi:hypothetical protein
MGMKCNIETLIGQQPESKFDLNKIILKPVTKIQIRLQQISLFQPTMMLLR